MSRRLHPQIGVTLVELVVVLTLLGLMASIGATLVSRIVAGQQENRGRLTLAQAARLTLASASSAARKLLALHGHAVCAPPRMSGTTASVMASA